MAAPHEIVDEIVGAALQPEIAISPISLARTAESLRTQPPDDSVEPASEPSRQPAASSSAAASSAPSCSWMWRRHAGVPAGGSSLLPSFSALPATRKVPPKVRRQPAAKSSALWNLKQSNSLWG